MTLKVKYCLIGLLTAAFFVFSCKKETSCEGCKENNKPPIAVAGPDQGITLPTDSILLDGSASNDPDGTISEWFWKKIEGPASFNIVTTTTAKTIVRNLDTGIYKFELKVTDDKNLSAIDTVQITVTDRIPANRSPVANAGGDQTITLPTNSVNLDGSASSDPDNNITAYAWTKISGPSSFNIVNANAAQTQVTNLVEGFYQFELKVTDAPGLFDRDTVTVTMQVTVCPQPSSPPPCGTNCGKIVFVSNRDGNDEIYTCNADGSNVTRLTNDPLADGQPAWSPDGTRIAFVRWSDLWIMNADGSNVVQLTFTGGYVGNPAWSPDGTRIAFHNSLSNYSVIVMNLASGTVSPLPSSEGSSVYPDPDWSPDGTKIAFDSDRRLFDIVSDIYTICPTGSGLTLLTPIQFNDHDYWRPSWSPDGTMLSVTIHQMNYLTEHDGSIGVMNADGSGLNIIKTGIVMAMQEETRTSWSPDGTRIIYTENKTIKWLAADGSSSGTIITNGWDADWKH